MALDGYHIRICAGDFQCEWTAGDSEAAVLRDFADQVRTRRAMDPSYGRSREEPDYLIESITDARAVVRELLSRLLPDATESRAFLLRANRVLASIQDAWSTSKKRKAAPRRSSSRPLSFSELSTILDEVWPTVEEARQWLQTAAQSIETSLVR